MKRCSSCGVEKPRSEFRNKAARRDGLSSQCKACQYAAECRWRAAHPEQAKAAHRTAPSHAPDREAARFRKYRQEHPERVNANNQRYREANKDRVRAWDARYRQEARGSNAPEVRAFYQAQRRARARQAEGSFTLDEWLALCETCDNRCLCCGRPEPLTVDHVVPLSKGGANDIGNIQPLCKPCNSKKGQRFTDYRRNAA